MEQHNEPASDNSTNTTRQQQEQRTHHSESPPVPTVSTQTIERTSNTGPPRRNIKWSNEMNISVLRAYYKATRIQKTGYRQQMHQLFISENPHLSHLSPQNLGDRRSAIERHNLISPRIRDQLRAEIQNETETSNIRLHNKSNTHQPQSSSRQNNIITDQNSNTLPNQNNLQTVNHAPDRNYQNHNPLTQQSNQRTTNLPPDDHNSHMIPTLIATFEEAKIRYLGMSAEHRPPLPRCKPNKNTFLVTNIVNNHILPLEITENINYCEILDLVYCSAYTIIQNSKHTNSRKINAYTNTTNNNNKKSRSKEQPAWQRRLQNEVDKIRKDLGYLTSIVNNRIKRRSQNKINNIKRRHRIHTQFDPKNRTIRQLIDTVKQKLTKYSQRLRRYKKNFNRKMHNNLFHTNEKHFYKMINQQSHSNPTTENMNITTIEEYWKSIWSDDEPHNRNNTWISNVQQHSTTIPTMTEKLITPDIFKQSIKKLENWKQPGNDKIHNFFYKYLTSLHNPLLKVFNHFLINPNDIPPTLCTGTTYLKAKVEKPTNASQYRPITCLNTSYKLFTSCINKMITNHLLANNILAEEQKGCRQGTKGCKDQLIIDSVVTKQALKNQKNLHTAFIDYQKAFDSIPHTWLLQSLEIYKINGTIINCIKEMMKHWKTTLTVHNGNHIIHSNPIAINRGIYQGDSLSPLLFCIALNPLSLLLQQSSYGYRLKNTDNNKITHCFYMDDLKIYANTKANRNKLLEIVEIFSEDIKLRFGIDKCKTQSITKGKYTQTEDYTTMRGEQITAMQEDEHYKYLGIRQHMTIDHKNQKKITTDEFITRLHKICRSKLNGRNLVKAINTYAIPLLTYTFGILKWSNTDLNNLDMKIRTTLTKYKYHHPKASVERINIPRKLGGRGILNIKILHDRQIQNLRKYFKKSATNSQLYNSICNADENLTALNLKNGSDIEVTTIENLIDSWKSKSIHGKYINTITQQYIHQQSTFNWLQYTNIFAETEGLITAIQDGVICTRNFAKYIIRDPTVIDDKCRRCGTVSETLQHLLNSCTPLVASHYKERHDQVGKIIHIEILKHLKIRDTMEQYYNYNPERIIENSEYKIYWDRSILIPTLPNTTIPNRPDMIIMEKLNKKAHIIDFAVPYDTNITETINTKKAKYMPLAQFLKTIHSLQEVKIIPIVISSTGTVPKQTVEAMAELNLDPKIITQMQKASLIKAASIIRETIG